MDRRRFLTTVGTASLFGLAGCSSDDNGDEPSQDDDADPDESGNEDPEGEETGSEDDEEDEEESGPTLDEVAYPAGASREGVSGSELYRTHESTLTDAGSLTLERSRDETHGGNEFSTTETNQFEANNIFQEIVDNGDTELVWGPADEDVSYVQMESGFEQGYRIDNQSPETNDVTGLREIRRFLSGVDWSEAKELVEVPEDTLAVRYESVGVPDVFGDQVEEFEATITVTESGYVREFTSDILRVDGDLTFDIQESATLTAVGETTVEPPEWTETAREEGVQFNITLTDDQRAYEIELLNGDEISASARIRLRDRMGGGESQLPQSISVGDQLYLALSESNEVLIDPDGVPDAARQLTSRRRVRIQSEFLLLEHSEEL